MKEVSILWRNTYRLAPLRVWLFSSLFGNRAVHSMILVGSHDRNVLGPPMTVPLLASPFPIALLLLHILFHIS